MWLYVDLTDPHGNLLVSDIYSFDEEEAVLDPHISEHLSHFGIDMLQMQKRVREESSMFYNPLFTKCICRNFLLWTPQGFTPSSPLSLFQTENGHNTDNNARPRVSEWEVIQESSMKLKAVYGSGYTGVKNLGNSCYFGTVLQVLFSIPDFQRM